jgi:hypothetical protein
MKIDPGVLQGVEDFLNSVTPLGVFAFVCWLAFAWWFADWVENKLAARADRRTRAAQQQATDHAMMAEYGDVLDRAARESWLRRAAIETALWEANKIADQLGFSREWINGQGWLFGNSADEQKVRLLQRSMIVEKYTAQILGNQQSPIDQLRQQNAYGDAGFAGALALQHARGIQSALSVNQVTYED